jgi:uncharacterized membrane protein YhaH (DUF805 family)
VLSKYATFSGRATRAEFWWWQLAVTVAAVLTAFLDEAVFGGGRQAFTLSLFLATLLPSLAVSVRRLHDSDHSGWWLLAYAIPLAGAVTLLWLFLKRSMPGPNRFGWHPASAG